MKHSRSRWTALAAVGATLLTGLAVVSAGNGAGAAGTPTSTCADPVVLGGVDLGCLPDYLFVFADGRDDANWQSASKGFVGDVAVDGIQAAERTSGSFAYGGTIVTNDSTLDAWQDIVDNNAGQATAVTGATATVAELSTALENAIATVGGLPATTGFSSRSATSLHGLDTTDGADDVTVINVTSGLQVSSQIVISGDPGDVFLLRWDTDGAPGNGLQGQVKFQSGGAIVPGGGLTPANFVHIAGDINASGGGSTPPAPFPQGPRADDGTGALVAGASDFSGGGFFTGYWLTTGAPSDGKTASMSNGIFVGGWYTLSTKFSLTSGTSGVHVSPPRPQDRPIEVVVECAKVTVTGGPINGITINYTDGTKQFVPGNGQFDLMVDGQAGKTIDNVWVNGVKYEFDQRTCAPPPEPIRVVIGCTTVEVYGGPIKGITIVYTDGTKEFVPGNDQFDLLIDADVNKVINQVWVNGVKYEFDESVCYY